MQQTPQFSLTTFGYFSRYILFRGIVSSGSGAVVSEPIVVRKGAGLGLNTLCLVISPSALPDGMTLVPTLEASPNGAAWTPVIALTPFKLSGGMHLETLDLGGRYANVFIMTGVVSIGPFFRLSFEFTNMSADLDAQAFVIVEYTLVQQNVA